MSKIFYDHLISLTEVEIHIKKAVQSPEEREELWQIIDGMLHHRMLTLLLDNLPKEFHTEFLEKFHKAPHDEELLVYVNERTKDDIEELIKKEADSLKQEIVKEMFIK